jgi:P27 family predicted phage terminase small subunit
MTKSRVIPPPEYLSVEAKQLWAKFTSEWQFEPHSLLLLESALSSLDRLREAQAIIRKEGLLIKGSRGYAKPHPAVLIERQARDGLLKNLMAIGLQYDPVQEGPGRPAGG